MRARLRVLPVIREGVNLLVHVPDLVFYGSKPAREIRGRAGLAKELRASLRSYQDARVRAALLGALEAAGFEVWGRPTRRRRSGSSPSVASR